MFDVKFGILDSSVEQLLPSGEAPPLPDRVLHFDARESSKHRVPRSESGALWYRTGVQLDEAFEKIIASPRCGSVSGKRTLLLLGEKFPLTHFSPRTGQFEVSYLDLGLKMELLGHTTLQKDSRIVFKLELKELQLQELVNGKFPLWSEDHSEAYFELENGEQLVIGGFSSYLGDAERFPVLKELKINKILDENPELLERLVLVIRGHSMH